jgi:hypothetical protein
MLSRRLPRISPTTVVASLSLFIALGGSGYAATRIASAASGGVKVRCSAKRGRKKVSCKVVKGSGTGPRGPRGLQGSLGPAGPSGPTTLTQPPGFSYAPGGTFPFLNTSGTSYDGGEEQEFTAYAKATSGYTGSTTLETALLSPSEVAGSATHVSSVQFCYGVYKNTNPLASFPSTISITSATVQEDDEPNAAATAAPSPPAVTTTPEAAPYAPPVPLISASFSPVLSGGYGCRTLAPSTPPAISSSGYLSLVLTVQFSAGAWSGAYPEGTISLGRVTTTYSPS